MKSLTNPQETPFAELREGSEAPNADAGSNGSPLNGHPRPQMILSNRNLQQSAEKLKRQIEENKHIWAEAENILHRQRRRERLAVCVAFLALLAVGITIWIWAATH